MVYEVAETCRTYGREEKCIQNFSSKPWGKDYATDVNRRTLLKLTLRKYGSSTWTGFIRHQCCPLVN
jgi:hypothetical protein